MAVPLSRVLASHTRLLASVSQLTAVVPKVATPARPGDIDFGGASANDGMLILLCCRSRRARLHLPFVAAVLGAAGKARTPPSARYFFFIRFMTC